MKGLRELHKDQLGQNQKMGDAIDRRLRSVSGREGSRAVTVAHMSGATSLVFRASAPLSNVRWWKGDDRPETVPRLIW